MKINELTKLHYESSEKMNYVKVDNSLLDALIMANFTARQLKVMLAYIRKTVGFGKRVDRIVDDQIATLTGLSRQNVNRTKQELLAMKCLFCEGKLIGINGVVSSWNSKKYSTNLHSEIVLGSISQFKKTISSDNKMVEKKVAVKKNFPKTFKPQKKTKNWLMSHALISRKNLRRFQISINRKEICF